MTQPYSSGFDAHTHLDHPRFDADRTDVCARARARGISGFLIAGADPNHWDRVLRIAREVDAYPVLGLHPWWVQPDTWPKHVARLETLLTPWGLGETGLDKTRPHRGAQRDALRAQLSLAADHSLPVILHCVRAYGSLLDEVASAGVHGMVHAWSGPPELVDRAVGLGLSLSFGSLVLRSERVAACAAAVPLSSMLLETDCPDMPIPGERRGEPSHLLPIAERIAALRGLSVAAVLEITGRNARALLRTSR